VTPATLLAVAPATGHPQMGLLQPAASRPAVHGSRDQQARDPHRDGHPDLGVPAGAKQLVKLGHPIAASTVRQLLHAAGTGPAPRRTGPAGKQFPTAQARSILAADFVHPGTVLLPRCVLHDRAAVAFSLVPAARWSP
jgi:hypothetical protein